MKTRLFPAVALCLALASCQTHNWKLYSTHLEEVKAVAPPGKNIRVAKKDLEAKGYDASKIYDPTGLGEKLWMNVHYGAIYGFWSGISYAADLPTHGPPGSILVEADPKGKIREVR